MALPTQVAVSLDRVALEPRSERIVCQVYTSGRLVKLGGAAGGAPYYVGHYHYVLSYPALALGALSVDGHLDSCIAMYERIVYTTSRSHFTRRSQSQSTERAAAAELAARLRPVYDLN